MIQPNTMSDVNGEYMAADYSTRKVGANEVHYSTFRYGIPIGPLIRCIRYCNRPAVSISSKV